jgi:hypothetical protein
VVSKAAAAALNTRGGGDETYSNGNESHYNEPIPAKPLEWNYF